jgi:hypothetical protein
MASVEGHEFALGALLRIGPVRTDLLDDLDAAFRARLMVETRAGTLERYAFAHALIQRSLDAELPPHRLRRRHQRVGRVERKCGRRSDVSACSPVPITGLRSSSRCSQAAIGCGVIRR